MTGQIAVVTGGSRGIGRSAVNHIAARGVDVIFTYREDIASAKAVIEEADSRGARVSAVQLDVSDVDALDEFVDQVRSELSDRGTDRLNYLVNNAGISHTLAPGATATDFSDGLIRDNPEYRKQVGAVTALGRPAEPDDIGRVIASLIGDDMGWINGERIEASGGMKL